MAKAPYEYVPVEVGARVAEYAGRNERSKAYIWRVMSHAFDLWMNQQGGEWRGIKTPETTNQETNGAA